MTNTALTRLAVTIATVGLVACGSSTPNQLASTTATIGSAGGTIQAGQTSLTIPAGALSAATVVTVSEAEPHHAGRAHRVEIQPQGLPLAQPAQVSVEIDDSNVKVKMHDGADDLVDVEIEDHNHGRYKTSMSKLDAVEVELEHGQACATACGSGQECDDGVCKAHAEDAGARTCSSVCTAGQECDDGVCKAHGDAQHVAAGTPAACVNGCATGLECDDGVCKPHGGTSGSGSGGTSGTHQ